MSLTNHRYSTTRMLTTQRPAGLKKLPVGDGRVAEGGLRIADHYKVSSPGKPLITVITVVLNRAHCFEKCIQSVIAQSYDNVEFVVIDGASTDGTVELLNKYNNQIDYWVSEPDMGLYYAMNKAVEIANGDWFYFIGSDDVLLDCLSAIMPQLQDDQNIYYGDVFYIAKQRIFNGPFSQYRFHAKGINHQGMFFPRRVFATDRYDTAYRVIADWDLNLRCFIDHAYQFIYIQELIAIYNDVDGLSTREYRAAIKEYRVITRKRLGFSGLFYTSRLSFICFLEVLRCKEPLRRLCISWTEAIRQMLWSGNDTYDGNLYHLFNNESVVKKKYSSQLSKMGIELK